MKKILSGAFFAFLVLMAGLVAAAEPAPLDVAKASAVAAVQAAEGSGDTETMVTALNNLLSPLNCASMSPATRSIVSGTRGICPERYKEERAQVLAAALNAASAEGATAAAILGAINQVASDSDLTSDDLLAANADPTKVLAPTAAIGPGPGGAPSSDFGGLSLPGGGGGGGGLPPSTSPSTPAG